MTNTPSPTAAAPVADKRLAVVVEAYTAEGFKVCFDLALNLSDLAEALRRLEAAGYTPHPPRAASTSAPARADKTAPIFNAAGAACCPVHQRPLKQGRYGWYCPAKDDGEGSKNGYCGLSYKDHEVA